MLKKCGISALMLKLFVFLCCMSFEKLNGPVVFSLEDAVASLENLENIINQNSVLSNVKDLEADCYNLILYLYSLQGQSLPTLGMDTCLALDKLFARKEVLDFVANNPDDTFSRRVRWFRENENAIGYKALNLVGSTPSAIGNQPLQDVPLDGRSGALVLYKPLNSETGVVPYASSDNLSGDGMGMQNSDQAVDDSADEEVAPIAGPIPLPTPQATDGYTLLSLDSVQMDDSLYAKFQQLYNDLYSYISTKSVQAENVVTVPLQQVKSFITTIAASFQKPEGELQSGIFNGAGAFSTVNIDKPSTGSVKELLTFMLRLLGGKGPFARDIKMAGKVNQQLCRLYSEACTAFSNLWMYNYATGSEVQSFEQVRSKLQQVTATGLFAQSLFGDFEKQINTVLGQAVAYIQNQGSALSFKPSVTVNTLVTFIAKVKTVSNNLDNLIAQIINNNASATEIMPVNCSVDNWFDVKTANQRMSVVTYSDAISCLMNIAGPKGLLYLCWQDAKKLSLGSNSLTLQDFYDDYLDLCDTVQKSSFYKYVDQQSQDSLTKIMTVLGGKAAASVFSTPLTDTIKSTAVGLLKTARTQKPTQVILDAFIKDMQRIVPDIDKLTPVGASDLILCNDVWFNAGDTSKTVATFRDAVSFIINVIADGGPLYKNLKMTAIGSGFTAQSLYDGYAALCGQVMQTKFFQYVDGVYQKKVNSVVTALQSKAVTGGWTEKLDATIAKLANDLLTKVRTQLADKSTANAGVFKGLLASANALIPKLEGLVTNKIKAGQNIDCSKDKWFTSKNTIVTLKDAVSFIVNLASDTKTIFYSEISMSALGKGAKDLASYQAYLDLCVAVSNARFYGSYIDAISKKQITNLIATLNKKVQTLQSKPGAASGPATPGVVKPVAASKPSLFNKLTGKK